MTLRQSLKSVHLTQDVNSYRSDKTDRERATHCFIPRLHVWAEETILSSVATSPIQSPSNKLWLAQGKLTIERSTHGTHDYRHKDTHIRTLFFLFENLCLSTTFPFLVFPFLVFYQRKCLNLCFHNQVTWQFDYGKIGWVCTHTHTQTRTHSKWWEGCESQRGGGGHQNYKVGKTTTTMQLLTRNSLNAVHVRAQHAWILIQNTSFY